MAPPDSGDLWTGVTTGVLPVHLVHPFLLDPRAGGTCVFVGSTRQWTGPVETRGLDYHAYEAMALESLRSLALDELAGDAVRVVALHRLGVVPLAEASVVVGAASAHRDGAFASARRLIDRLKDLTPIWKRDLAPHG